MLMNEEWAEFLSENHFLVGVSLDGPRKQHDQYRLSVSGSPTFANVMNTIRLFHQYGVSYNILTVVTNDVTAKVSG